MRRLLIGLGSAVFMLVTIILVVPLLLPKDEIKRQVVEQVDNRLGWRLRLDGPVSLSLFPWFSLVAEKVGVSGEAGADGIEFAKAERVEFGLAWAGLVSGNIQVTGIALDRPDIFLEVGPNGTTSWEPRRDLSAEGGTETSDAAPAAPQASPGENAAEENAQASRSGGYLKSIGIDRLRITGGALTWKGQPTAQPLKLTDLDLTLNAPDMSGEVSLDSRFTLQDVPLAVAGTLSNPLELSGGGQVPLDLTVSSGDNVVKVSGTTGLEPVRADLVLAASGPSLKALAALAGQELDADPGAYALDAKVAGTEAAVSVGDLTLSLGQLSLGGAAAADLSGLVPEVSGRLVLKEGSIADLLLLAGQDLPASGRLSADLAFETVGLTGEELVAGLDINGSVRIADGEIGGLGLASAVGGDPEADRLTNLAMDIDLNGLENPISLTGSLAWRGEGFSLTGDAATAQLLAGEDAPVSVTVKGNRLSAGFNGRVSRSGNLDGAVSVDTADLRGLMAWMGQPIGAGGGLKRFKASGIFGVKGDAVSFEETRFTLDDTSGEASGRIVLGAKPSVTARLDLRELVLDPYLGGSAQGGRGTGGAPAASGGGGNSGGSQGGGSGWSTAPVDFSGLKAVDADFQLTTSEIRWDRIKIDQSALSATIRDGVLTADLEKLALYGGSGSGTVTLDGAASVPAVSAKFALADLNAYPLLRDAADFSWIEGKAAINLDVRTAGGSEQALVQGLNGTADYRFMDGAIRGINIPQIVRGLSVETLLGWQANPSAKTDFSSLGATFRIENGVATTDDLSLVGPLVRMAGKGTTDMPAQRLSWRVEPKIVPTLEGQAPQPRRKGEDKKLAGLGVPIVIEGNWNDPRIYPDIKGILENPEAAYKQLEKTGGELISILKGDKPPSEALVDQANKVIEQATGGRTQIDVQKVIDGEVDDEEVLKAVEEGFGLPQGLLGNVFGKKKKEN
jgi:AsmA protein